MTYAGLKLIKHDTDKPPVVTNDRSVTVEPLQRWSVCLYVLTVNVYGGTRHEGENNMTCFRNSLNFDKAGTTGSSNKQEACTSLILIWERHTERERERVRVRERMEEGEGRAREGNREREKKKLGGERESEWVRERARGVNKWRGKGSERERSSIRVACFKGRVLEYILTCPSIPMIKCSCKAFWTIQIEIATMYAKIAHSTFTIAAS